MYVFCEYECKWYDWKHLYMYNSDFYDYTFKFVDVKMTLIGSVTGEINQTSIPPAEDDWQQWTWCCRLRLTITSKVNMVILHFFIHFSFF